MFYGSGQKDSCKAAQALSEQLQIGDSISFYRDGELVKTCTILAKACTVGTEDETPTTTTATMHIGGDAPFVYLPDTVFKQIYTTPTLLNYQVPFFMQYHISVDSLYLVWYL